MTQSIPTNVVICDIIALIVVALMAPWQIRIWLGMRPAMDYSPLPRISLLTGRNPKRWAGNVMAQTAYYLSFTFLVLSVPAYAISGTLFAIFAVLCIVSFAAVVSIICFWWPKILIPKTLRFDTKLLPLMKARIKRQ